MLFIGHLRDEPVLLSRQYRSRLIQRLVLCPRYGPSMLPEIRSSIAGRGLTGINQQYGHRSRSLATGGHAPTKVWVEEMALCLLFDCVK